MLSHACDRAESDSRTEYKLQEEITHWKQKCEDLNAENMKFAEMIGRLESRVTGLETTNRTSAEGPSDFQISKQDWDSILLRLDDLTSQVRNQNVGTTADTANPHTDSPAPLGIPPHHDSIGSGKVGVHHHTATFGPCILRQNIIQLEVSIAVPVSNRRHTVVCSSTDLTLKQIVERLYNLDMKINNIDKSSSQIHGDGPGENPNEEKTEQTVNPETAKKSATIKSTVDNSRRAIDWISVGQTGQRSLPKEVGCKINECRASILASVQTGQDGKPNEETDICAVYLYNVPRGPISELKKGLGKCLPRWAFLSVYFIGANIAAFLCHQPFRDRLISTAKMLGLTHAQRYDPTKARPNASGPDTAKLAKQACIRRCLILSSQVPAPAIKRWYSGLAAQVNSKLEEADRITTVEPRGPRSAQPTATDDVRTTAARKDDRTKDGTPATSDNEDKTTAAVKAGNSKNGGTAVSVNPVSQDAPPL